MDASEIDVLVQRLVANPHDQEALAYAHNAGNADPKSYAIFLEKVGNATSDPGYASHWLSEAANVWSITLGDAHRAARVLMMAVDKDPTQETAAERLAQLYREKGEHKALVALLERRARALAPLIGKAPELRLHLAGIHEELGRLWSEAPLSMPKKAIENYRRAIELDPTSAYAVYALRELYKQSEQWADAVPLFAMEQGLISDRERKLALYRDEAGIRKLAGDPAGATQALRDARAVAQDDPALVQELGTSILERMQAGQQVAPHEKSEAADLFVFLAESYDGQHGLAYSTAALDVSPGHDRAMQLAAHYARELGRSAEIGPRWEEYLRVNPSGPMAGDARRNGASGSGGESSSAALRLPSAPPGIMSPLPTEAVVTGASEGSQASYRTNQLLRALQEALAFVNKQQKPQALAKYKEVLALDPGHPEALPWVEDYLRQKRQYAELRDVLMQSARSPEVSKETRKQQLLEVAGLCETQLRDLETAIQAWKQICSIDRADTSAKDHLRRLLERGARWDELAGVLEQEAMGASDVETKVLLEKKLAQLHEVKRKDLVAAGDAWGRIAALLSGDETPIQTAVKLFEKGQRRDLACQVIADNAASIEDKGARASLYLRMGELYEKSGELGEAGEAYVQAAEADGNHKTWESAERCLVAAERWDRAAFAAGQRAELTGEPKARAALLVRASGFLVRAGDTVNALTFVEGASALDPHNDAYADEIEGRYLALERYADLADFHLARAAKLDDRGQRAALRKRAATIQSDRLRDLEGARETLLKALEDGDDPEILSKLADDAEMRGDPEQARDFLHRLVALSKAPDEKARVALREAKILAEGLDDVEGAIARYSYVLEEVDPKNRDALRRIAELEQKRGNSKALAETLERELKIVTSTEDKLEIARQLAGLYEGALADPSAAIRSLDVVHELDPEDFDATSRLEVLCEKVEDWSRVATLLQALVEIEGDEHELSTLSRKLSGILVGKLDRGDDALAVLLTPADAGDPACREAYVELADKLGWKGLVASKLVEWHGESPPTPARNQALRGAFERFLEVERHEDAAKVAIELARSKGADYELAERLEAIATKLKDLEAMSVAHDLLARELNGIDRAVELVRQAEVLVKVGVDPAEAQQHGETGLGSVPPAQAEPLLARLAALNDAPGPVIDVYERQVGRCKTPADRLAALARAAQVAGKRGAPDRTKSFYELALSAGVPEETLLALELSATQGDRELGDTVLRKNLAEALAAGGQGARDGGRTRGLLLRRAAQIAQRDLGDIDRAFDWLGDALIAHVDAASLEALDDLASEVEDLKRAEATLGRALADVFDGPLVRQVLAHRVKLRRDKLGDKAGAAEDLKKLHDLSPADAGVMEELSQLLTELGDFRGMVHVLEDQILRGKEPAARAELARKVARLWDDQLKDPREAADAWRRVLRMKSGDTEAQAGLERAKAAMLTQRKAEPVSQTSVPDVPPVDEVASSANGAAPAGGHWGEDVVPASQAEPEESAPEPSSAAAEEVPVEEAPAVPPTPAEEEDEADTAAAPEATALTDDGEKPVEPAKAEAAAEITADRGRELQNTPTELLMSDLDQAGETTPIPGESDDDGDDDGEDVLAVDDSELVEDVDLLDDADFADEEDPDADQEPNKPRP